MQPRLYPLAVFTSTLMVTLTTQSSVAFNITGPTESYVPSVVAPVGNKRVDVWLEPKSVKSIKQIIDWRIDYTATTGQLLKQNVLVSSIFKDYQPIGLYSHRLNAAIRLTPRFANALNVTSIATIVCAIAPSVYPHS